MVLYLDSDLLTEIVEIVTVRGNSAEAKVRSYGLIDVLGGVTQPDQRRLTRAETRLRGQF